MAPRLPVLNQGRTVAECDPRMERGPRCYLSGDSMHSNGRRGNKSRAWTRRDGIESQTQRELDMTERTHKLALKPCTGKHEIVFYLSQTVRTTDNSKSIQSSCLKRACQNPTGKTDSKRETSTFTTVGAHLSTGRPNNPHAAGEPRAATQKRMLGTSATCRSTGSTPIQPRMTRSHERHKQSETSHRHNHFDGSSHNNPNNSLITKPETTTHLIKGGAAA